jgi:hypothetical protein
MAALKNYDNELVGLLRLFTFVVRLFFSLLLYLLCYVRITVCVCLYVEHPVVGWT